MVKGMDSSGQEDHYWKRSRLAKRSLCGTISAVALIPPSIHPSIHLSLITLPPKNFDKMIDMHINPYHVENLPNE